MMIVGNHDSESPGGGVEGKEFKKKEQIVQNHRELKCSSRFG